MRFAELVATASTVGATPARSAKVAALADLLRRLRPDEVVAAVGFLTGRPRQGRVGVGWATVAAVSAPPAPHPELEVADVDAALGNLLAVGGAGAVGERRARLGALLGRATAEEADFIRRLLLAELRQGALEGVMVDAVAKAAEVPLAEVRRAAMVGGDLARAAQAALGGGREALRAIGLQVLQPVQPMLAAPGDDVADALASTGAASVEWKLDGARVQVHRSGDEVRVFTRNLNDVTDRLPGVVAAARALPEPVVVLDGEVIGLDEAAQPHRFQDTMSRLGREGGGGDLTGALRPFFFDVLHVGGDDLLDRPLVERLAVLEVVAGGWRVPSVATGDVAEAAALLDSALRAGHEGVVVKALDSPYVAGRRGGSWRKVKPVATVDLVVLAAEWGSGRRRGWLSNLHLGARDPAGGFVMVGKTFKGLTDELLTWQTAALLARQVAQEGHVVHVRPELVVEIALDGVQVSRRYPGGVALRFARVRRYRPEKSPAEADTIDAVRALLQRPAPA